MGRRPQWIGEEKKKRKRVDATPKSLCVQGQYLEVNWPLCSKIGAHFGKSLFGDKRKSTRCGVWAIGPRWAKRWQRTKNNNIINEPSYVY